LLFIDDLVDRGWELYVNLSRKVNRLLKR